MTTLTNLPRGTYQVKAELQGFKSLTQADVLLTVGDTVRLDFTMEVGSVAETVRVRHSDAVERDFRGVGGTEAQLPPDLGRREAPRVRGDEEARHALKLKRLCEPFTQ